MNGYPAPEPILEVIDGPAGGEFRVDPRGCLIGRGGGVAISLEDPDVSRRHARLVTSGDGGVVITDLGSTNGTWVNGVPLAGSRPLLPGDHVRVGRVTLRFHQVGGGMPGSWPAWGAPESGGPVEQRVEVGHGRTVQVAGRDAIHGGMHIGRLRIGVAGLAVVAALLVAGFVGFPPVSLDEAAGHWENPGMSNGRETLGRMQLDITADGTFRLRGSLTRESLGGPWGKASETHTADCSGSVDVQWHRLAFRVSSGRCAGNFYGRLVQDGRGLDAYNDKTQPVTLFRGA